MSVACTTCGHQIPAGQFRCGKCGALAPRESLEDFGGLTEVLNDASPAPAIAPGAPVGHASPGPSRIERSPATSERLTPAPPERRHDDAADGEASQQIETVPKGTFASETPAAPFPARDDAVESKPPLAAREAGASASSSGSRSIATGSSQRVKVRQVVKPPFLASEILREDLTPLTPGKHAMWLATQIGAPLGALATLLLGYDTLHGVLTGIALLALFALGRAPMEYTIRATAVTGLAGLGLTAATTARVAMGAGQDDPVLAVACALLPAALLFRSWYRAAPRARVLVAGTVPLAFAWAAMTSHRGLLSLAFTWQSWLPALAWYLFVILCLLSLLAFMGDETTGGCAAWALGLGAWFSLFALLRAAMEAQTFAHAMHSAASALGVAEAAFAAPLAVGLAQLHARAFVSEPRVRNAT